MKIIGSAKKEIDLRPKPRREFVLKHETESMYERYSWATYFDGCEVYKGVAIRYDERSDKWWGWDGHVIHQSNSEANIKRAIDLGS